MLKNLFAFVGGIGLSIPLLSASPLPDSVQTTDGTLAQCHQTDITVMTFIHVADASLYAEDCTTLPVLTSPYQLSFVYYKAISADDFIDAAETWLKRNLSAADFAAIAPEMDTFNSAYQSVVSGDRYDIRRNSDGLFLIKNGETISHSQSPLLAQQYFNIWFGSKPFDASLKRELLTGE